MPVPAKPDHYHSVTPALIVQNGAAAIDFYKAAFHATELMRFPGPDGKVMHAELRIGDSTIMLCDEFPDMDYRGPQSRGGTTVTLMIYVENCDAVFDRAVAAGATIVRPVENQFYGDRSGTIADPFGHIWTLSTHVEDVTPDEMTQRFDTWMTQQSIA